MEFTYPVNCSYCHSRIGSKDCLLPYEFVCDYDPPKDFLSRTIDITELHATYGNHQLQINFEFMHRVRTRPTSEVIQAYSESISQRSEIGSTFVKPKVIPQQNTDGTDRCQTPTGNSDPVPDHDTPPLRADVKSDSLPPSNDTEVQPSAVQLESPTYADKLAKGKARSATPNSGVTKLTGSTQPQLHDDEVTEFQLKIEALSPEQERHLVSTLTMAIAVAHATTTKQSLSMKASKLIECLDVEISMKERLRSHYHNQTTTKLDHPIAMARELVSLHSSTEILSWQEGRTLNCSKCCVLNYPPLKSTSIVADNDTLVQTLVNYCSSIANAEFYTQQTKDNIFGKAKIALEQRGNNFAYNWIKSKLRSTNNPSLHAQDGRSKTSTIVSNSKQIDSDSQLRILSPAHGGHKCPAIEQGTLELLSTELDSAVDTALKATNKGQQNFIKSISNHDFIFTIICEFVKHNKSWINPNSMSSTKSLQKAIDNCNFEPKSEDLTNILWITSEAVNLLRNLSRIRTTHS